MKLYFGDMKGIPAQDVRTDIDVVNTRATERPGHPTQKPAASLERTPRLQIITVEQALNGAKPAIPLIDTGAAFKRAARETAAQPELDI